MAHPWKRLMALAATPALMSMLLLATPAWAKATSAACKRGTTASACKTSVTPIKTKKAAATSTLIKQPTTRRTRVSKTTSRSAAVVKVTATKTKAARTPRSINARQNTAHRGNARVRNLLGTQGTVPAATLAQTTSAVAARPLVVSANTSRADAASLRSNVAYVQDLETSTVLFSKNGATVAPIASISKLMTALVVIDANQPLDQILEITHHDVDRLRNAPSRLNVGTKLTRADMLHLALMSSENRAANALGRHYPGGLAAFARAMNNKARSLGMYDTHFVEPTGLSSENVSSPRDLVRLIRATAQRPLIHRYSTGDSYQVRVGNGRVETFRNTNLLVRKDDWDIRVSKTGYISEAGECLVMLTRVNGRDLAIVLLNAQGKLSRIGDAVRLRNLLEKEVAML